MMSKFTRSLAFKGNDLHASFAVPVAPTGSLNVDGGGGGLPSSAYGPTYGQQQNGAGGQQPSKPSIKAGEVKQQNGGDGSYPSATPEPRTKHNTESAERPERSNSRGYPPHQKEEKKPEMKSERHTSAEKDNEREVKEHDNNQMIQSPSMSTQSQRDKVLTRSKTEERTSAPADPPARPQGGIDGMVVAYIVVPNVPWGPPPAYKDTRMQSQESKTRDDKAQGGTTAGVQLHAASNEPYTYNNRQTSSKDRAAGATQMDQVAPGGTPLTAPSREIQDRKSPTRSPPKTNIQQASQPVKEEKKGGCCSIL